MPSYVEIAVNVPQVADVFHYHLPPDLEGQVEVGQLVVAPFGRQRVSGVVLRFVDRPAVAETRPIDDIVEPETILTGLQLELARVLAETSLASISDFLALMLPPGLGQQAESLYERTESPLPARLTDTQNRLISIIESRGPLRTRQIDRAMGRRRWRTAARSLVQRGLLRTRPVLQEPQIGPKTVRTARLACPPREAEAALPNVARAGSQALERRQAILRFLIEDPGPVDVSWVYARSGGNSSDLRHLEKLGLIALGETEVFRDPVDHIETPATPQPTLTHDQAEVWEQVRNALQNTGGQRNRAPFLLHGVTGSGKTEIYLQAVKETLAQGRQAIILVPEIALTPQTVRRFISRFPGQVGLAHSGLSSGERFDTWRRARLGELSVVVGPRSALFTPFPNLGLIVLDESHDDSYYQSEPPFYHARQAAVEYARLSGAVCILGSATPDVTSTYQAAQGRWRYLKLPARILAHQEAVRAQMEQLGSEQVSRYRPLEGQAQTLDLPPVQVVDMRIELKSGNRSIFSHAMQAALREVLEKGQQAILFLNRLGTATYVFCRDCGHSLKCPRCDIPLIYHVYGRRTELVCHHCDYRRSPPRLCPECGSERIRHYGTGTERVESELESLLPGVRTLRWDATTTRTKGSHDAILTHFANRRADVLVGTQMLAKGLDLPHVTLVGVVLADVGLNLPDYRAGERTFQVLTQVAGRAGRSPLGGRVVLQSFQPEHYVIQAAAGHNYRRFYEQELAYRRRLGYPPFTQLVRLEVRNPEAEAAERSARVMADQIRDWLHAGGQRATQMIGPAPCFFARLNGQYRWQIILRGPDPAAALRSRPLDDFRVEVNPPNLL